MRIQPLERIAAALRQIGAVEIERHVTQKSGEATTIVDHTFRGHIIRAAWNLRDDLSVSVSAAPAGDPEAASWRSLFSVTVPGFDQFGPQQQLAWVLSVPEGPAADLFIADHIRKLPDCLPTP